MKMNEAPAGWTRHHFLSGAGLAALAGSLWPRRALAAGADRRAARSVRRAPRRIYEE